MTETWSAPERGLGRLVAASAGAAVAAAALAVLFGWAADIDWLKSPSSKWVTVKPNTAACLASLGAALFLAASERGPRRGRRACLSPVRLTFCAFAGLVGLASLLEYATGVDLGIDGLLFPEAPGAVHTSVPGRMAMPTALCLSLLGLAFCLQGTNDGRSAFSHWACHAVTILSTIVILSYAYGVEAEKGLGAGTYMAFLSALCFFLLSMGLPLLDPDRGLWAMLGSRGPAGSVARRLLPAALLVPSIIAGLKLEGDRLGLYDPSFGVLVVAATYMLLLSLLVTGTARSLERSELVRARAEEAAKRKDQLLALTGEMAKVGGWEFDVETGEGSWTDEVARIHGVDPALSTSASFGLGFYEGESRSKIEAAITRAAAEAMPYDLELELNAADGSHKRIRTIGIPVLDKGKILRIRGIFQDISERYRAQEALRQSEERFSKAFASSPMGQSISTLSDGRIIDVNAAYCRIVGYSREELIGRRSGDLGLFADPGTRKALILDLARGASVKDSRVRVRTRLGRTKTVQLSMTAIVLEGEDCIIASVMDISSRLRAEKALRESEKRFRLLFDSSPIPMSLAGLDGAMLFLNRSFSRLFGYEIGELPTLDALRETLARSPSSRDRFSEAWERALRARTAGEGSEILPLELELRCKGGSTREVELSCAFLEGGALSIFNDVTERRRAEAARSEVEGRYRAFVEQATESLFVHDLDGRFTEVNRRSCEALGYAREELLSMNIFDIETGIEPERMRAAWAEVDSGRFITIVGRQRRKDGTSFPVEVRLGSLDWRGQKFILGLARDISERIEAERAIRASEERYRGLFENMIEGFAYCRMEYEGGEPVDFTCLAVNPAFTALTGLGDVVGKRATEIVPGARSSDPDFFAAYGRVARTRTRERFELELKARGIWVSVSVYFPAPEYFVAVFDVITERKRAEAEILALNTELEERVRRRTSQLEEANTELEAFSYSVSHDLRSPLRGIDGWSAAIEEEFGEVLDRKAMEYLSRVRAEARRMGELIDSLLQLARVSRAEMKLEDLDLSELASSIALRMREAYRGREISFSIDPGLRALGDRKFVEIALVNLFDNACKFTAKREFAAVEFGRSTEGSFYLRDNGAGFDMAYAARLFAPFQRMHKASEYPGTGIGLATVQRIVAKHGGRIRAESKNGEGTTFYFTLEEGQ
jgi:PAS domain S-box-containing protein